MELDAPPYYEYTTFSTLEAFNPQTAELTCAEIVRRRIRLETTTTWSLSLIPNQIIDYSTGFIPLYILSISQGSFRYPNGAPFISCFNVISLNCAGILDIMSSFDATATECSTIFHEVGEAIWSMSYEERGVTAVKILKITTKVYEIDRESEKLLVERYGSVPADDDSREIGLLRGNSDESTECVICLEDYIEGSIVVKLPCGHHFHGVCINQWSQIKRLCPLCQTQIPALSYFPFFLWVS